MSPADLERIARRMSVTLSRVDLRTIRKYLRGEPVRGTMLAAELEAARVKAIRDERSERDARR